MSDFRLYPKDFLREFIELYKSFPSLWKVNSREYLDRNLKAKCYNALVEKFKEVEPTADRYFVAKKINSIRLVYRRKLKQMSEQANSGADGVPTCNLWYFKLLSFLKDQMAPPLTSTSNGASFESTKVKNVQPETDDYTPNILLKMKMDLSNQAFNRTENKYDWLGQLVVSEINKLNDEDLQEALVWEIQKILHEALIKDRMLRQSHENQTEFLDISNI